MKYIKIISILFFVLAINSYAGFHSLDITHNEKNEYDFESYVNTLEKKMKNCFEIKKDGILSASFSLVREDHYKPRHVKLKFFHEDKGPYAYFSYEYVVYIIKGTKSNEVIVRERKPLLQEHRMKQWFLNNMECDR